MADIIIKVIEPAQTVDLMTLDELKTKLSISPANTAEDATLQLLITAYSDVIAVLCNRTFAKETLSETWRDLDSNRIFLSHYPIATETDVESVECPRGTDLDPSVLEIELASGKIELMASQSEPIVITYTGGYNLPDEAPPALKEALAIMIRNERMLAQQAAVGGVRSLSHKESRVVYFDPNAHRATTTSAAMMPMNAPVNALLMHYVRLQV
jgi:hypothetical protein